MFERKSVLLDIVMMSFACVSGCLNTTSYSYNNRQNLNKDPYAVYSPVVFSYCEFTCTNDDRCTYFTFTNSTYRCNMYNVSTSTWWYSSCSDCITGKKIEPCELQPQDTTNISVPTTTATTPTTTTATTTPSTTTTTTTTPEPPLQTTRDMETKCSCVCKETNRSVDDIFKERLKALSVNISNLSATKRKLSCAEDHRPSANNIGYFGLIALGLFGGFLIVFDCVNMFLFFIRR